jgi:hypothetical protein
MSQKVRKRREKGNWRKEKRMTEKYERKTEKRRMTAVMREVEAVGIVEKFGNVVVVFGVFPQKPVLRLPLVRLFLNDLDVA